MRVIAARGIASALAAACLLSPAYGAAATHAPQVIVVRRGWHIDVGFAAADLEPPLRSIARDFQRQLPSKSAMRST